MTNWTKVPKPMAEDEIRLYMYGKDFVDDSGVKKRVRFGDNVCFGGGMHYQVGTKWTKVGTP